MRLFIGIEFPTPVVAELCSLQDEIRQSTKGGRYPAKENLHLTLQFLGETPEDRVASIDRLLATVACRHAPFQLEFCDRLGYFGQSSPVRVIWLGLKGDLAALSRLQENVATAMRELGFAGEERAYTPHITLARDVMLFLGMEQRPGGWIDFPVRAIPPVHVDRFSLIVSRVEQNKRVYCTLSRFRLEAE